MTHDLLMTSGFALLFVTAMCQVQVAAQNKAASAVSALAYGKPDVLERVETTNAILSLKAGSGDLVGVQWKNPKLDIIAEGRLGENFRILLPRPDYEANYFNSREQVVRRIEKSASGVVVHYGPLKNEREQVDMKVAYEICDTGKQLQFSIQVDNRTDRPLAEVLYAIIGGQQGIGDRHETLSLVPGAWRENQAPKLFSQFPTYVFDEGDGKSFSTATFSYPGGMSMGWMDIYNPTLGVGYYYANQDPQNRVTALYTEVRPYTTWLVRRTDNWPNANVLPPNEPMGLAMGWVNFPYISKGSFRAGPIALQVHQGDWRAGSKLYRTWFDQHFRMVDRSWLSQEMAWQGVMLATPDDVILHRFEDLPSLAAEGKKYGVTTLEIWGWHVGGIDRGDPHYQPNPRLGTVDDFRRALSEVRAMGVHPILFVYVEWADTSEPAFLDGLSQYGVAGRWAADWNVMRDQVAATIGGSSHLLGSQIHRNSVLVSVAHPALREHLLRDYVDRIGDGAEGLHFEGGFDVGFLDFNPTVPGPPDQSQWLGVETTFAEFLRRARTINPQVAVHAAGYLDRALPYVDVGRVAILERDEAPMAFRYTFPEWVGGTYVESPEDFDAVNYCLRYGLIWALAARLHTGRLDEPLMRPLSQYLAEMIRIRKQYAHLLFHGRLSDPPGATVTGDKDNIRYSMFQPMDPKDPARAAVVVNFGERDEAVQVRIDGREGREVTISVPFERDRTAVLPVKLTLPAHRAAVVVAEQ